MQRPDPESAAGVRRALGDAREDLFTLAERANRLRYRRGSTDVDGFIQRANYNLSEAQRELASV